MAFVVAFFAGQIQVTHSSDSESYLRLKFLVLFLAASCPEFEPHLGLLLALFLLALAGLQSLDAAGAHVRALLVLGKPDCSFGAALPVFRCFPHLDGAAHSLLDLLGVLPGVALRVVAYKNRLTKRDAVGDCVNGVLCAVSVLSASGAKVFQAVGLRLGPLNQSSIFVADLTGQLNAKVFAARCPHRGNKKVLFRCPLEPCGLYALIGCCV